MNESCYRSDVFVAAGVFVGRAAQETRNFRDARILSDRRSETRTGVDYLSHRSIVVGTWWVWLRLSSLCPLFWAVLAINFSNILGKRFGNARNRTGAAVREARMLLLRFAAQDKKILSLVSRNPFSDAFLYFESQLFLTNRKIFLWIKKKSCLAILNDPSFFAKK